ncbi:MAG: DUF739 family protein [Bacteroidota bacterium]|nr:DUF739 family protein [Bacteroidota bacterium]
MEVLFDYSKLRGRIKEKFGTEGDFSSALGMGRVSLSQRLNNILEFSSKEMLLCSKLLDFPVTEIPAYFFCLLSSETRT